MTTPSTSEDGKGWPVYYTVVLLLFAAVFISYIDRTNISVAAVAMQDELGWNETRKGTVLSAFFVGYLLMMAASGALANRYGGRLVLGVAVIWWSLFTMLTPPAALLSFSALIAARIALGLGEAAVFPASINMVGRWVPPHFRSRATALFASALSFGTLFSLPATGWLVKSYGWHMPFYLFGAVGLVWAVVWFLKVGDGRGPDAMEMPAHERQADPVGTIVRHARRLGDRRRALLRELAALPAARLAAELLQDDFPRLAQRCGPVVGRTVARQFRHPRTSRASSPTR